ncbi:MAG: hypothetical protein JNK23_10730 [Opitutaceae bacterium]|nr:hypothetical protein [Opitutaceae bacterium]
MRVTRIIPWLLLPIGGAAFLLLWNPRPTLPPRADPVVKGETVAGTAAVRGAITGPADAPLAGLAYAHAWAEAGQPEAMTAFRGWTERFLAAPAAERTALAAEGVSLARTRRAAMLELIKADPQRALATTVPVRVRRELPEAVAAQLEQRVAGRGEFALLAASPAPGEPLTTPGQWREALIGGATYTAHVYGRREAQTAVADGPLHGIALDRQLALHENPLRVLEPGEKDPADGAGHLTWAVGDAAAQDLTPAHPPQPEISPAASMEPGACPACAALLERELARLIAAEDGPAPPPAPSESAEPERTHTIGAKQVLVIRVDFSDFPGEPVTQATATNVLSANVAPLFEAMSYGKTTLTAVVSDTVYRLPQTGAAYATANNNTQLHTDARTAAAAHYTTSQFDRIIVVFPNLGASRVPGSQITYGGLGSVNGTNIWINGPNSFSLGTVAHELGHTYGLSHSNLWRINDGNPVSASGNSLEYGDPFDMMGSTAITGITRDARHHFNHWQKNRLGWLPDTAVTTATTSGIYRIYRFDHRNASLTEPLALRVFRDGVRWFWVGYRQNFTAGTLQTNGAHVVWGYNNRQQSQLLDLVTPGLSANDATLPVGSTFTDAATGISIKALARGGADPAQYLDVEVTVPARPADVVAAWGREGASFYDGDTGLAVASPPETFVPFNLSGIRAIAGGNTHAIALKVDGTVVAWGNNTNSQATVPAGLSGVISVAAGGDVSGAVRSDGTVRLWGSNTSGQTTVPAGLADVKQLAIGRNHVLALRHDGTVTAWGVNAQGQANVPAGLADVVAVTAGAEISAALKRDGTVVGWGNTSYRPPAGLTGIAAISSFGALTGGQFTVALRADGTVTAWGANNAQQLAVPAGLSGVVAIAAGSFHTLALKSDGSVVGWGTSTSLPATVPRSMPRSFAIASSANAGFSLVGASVQFTAQPQNQTVALGADVTFRAAATGVGALGYQWRKDGADIAGATGSTLTLRGVTAAQAGSYDVVVTDTLGATVSLAGRLTLGAPVPEVARISNLSIRTRAGTGPQTLIVGFVVGGAGTGGTKPLLLRGIGPALTAFGVGGALADPKLEVYNATSVKLFENDNWNAADASTFAAVGAFPLTTGSRDAALYNSALAAAGYSAQVSGIGGATGVALAEIYDLTPALIFGAGTPRLINVSARTVSGTGADVLIAGFVIAGPPGSAKRVLLRAIGPTLTVFGVAGVLADPKLELFNASSVKIQENDNWGGAAELAAAFGAVGAFGLDGASRDAALVTTLAPGNYSAQVSGIGGGTGVALVEVYEVP